MDETYFKYGCGLIMNRKVHDKIKKKVVFDKFEVTLCPKYEQFGGWNIMRKIGDNYEEIRFGKKKSLD